MLKMNLMNQPNPYLILVSPEYITAIIKLNEKLEGKNIDWVLGGDVSEALQAVRVQPDCIEVVTTKEGTEKIHKAVEDLEPEAINFQVHQLHRNAIINEKEYPIYVRSNYFEFSVDSIRVKVHGDLQFRISDWAWGDKFEIAPASVYVVGKKTFVVPLYVQYELYQSLGWLDRAEKITWVIANRERLLLRKPKLSNT